jgi:nucleoid-associated protein YgaU
MQGIEFDRRRQSDSRGRFFGGRGFVQVLVGALAIAAIVLAFSSNSVEAPTEVKEGGAAGQPTSVPAAVVPLATATPTAVPTSAAPQKDQATAKPQVATRERVHEVVSGDTLAKISIQYYGDEKQFQKIFEANKDVLETPDSLQVGQKLKIPE